MANHIFGYVLMLSNPLVIGFGVVAMRKMKKMHESVVTTYMNSMLMVAMLAVVYATGSDLSLWQSFGWLEWVTIIALSFTNVVSQRFRFKAIQQSQVSRLQPLTPTQSFFQFACDLFFFNVEFTTTQYVGVAVVFLVFVVMVGDAAFLHKDKQQEKKQIDEAAIDDKQIEV